MGDALRMERLAVQERAFVRTVPSRGHLGGIAPSTMAMCMLFNAAGYDWIFIETVGVGQNEVRIIDVADLYLLLVPPASGDEIQGMKRGIMEIADLVLVTKNDGPYKAIARQTLVSYRQALRLLGPNLDGIQAEVINISSLERKGFDEVKKKMDELVTYMKSKGIMAKRKERQIANFIREQLLTEALQILFRHPEINATYHHLMAEMRTHQRAPHSVIHLLMEKIEKVIGNPGNG
jgi:LAO/AO transport system kinase